MFTRQSFILVAVWLFVSLGTPAVTAPAPPPAQGSGGGPSFAYDHIELPPSHGLPYRFSLCYNRWLNANEISKVCNANDAKGLDGKTPTITGGHNAPYVFKSDSGILPRGAHLDGNGVLFFDSNVSYADLSKVEFHICVTQLTSDAPNCLGGVIGKAPVAKAASSTPQQQAEQPKARSGAGPLAGALGAAVGGGLALGIYEKNKAQQSTDTSGTTTSGGQCSGLFADRGCIACTDDSQCGSNTCFLYSTLPAGHKAPLCH
jgi:hypothetical protein